MADRGVEARRVRALRAAWVIFVMATLTAIGVGVNLSLLWEHHRAENLVAAVVCLPVAIIGWYVGSRVIAKRGYW